MTTVGFDLDSGLWVSVPGGIGVPNPPPPGVNMVRMSPGKTFTVFLPPKLIVRLSGLRVRVLRPLDPGSPPFIPYGWKALLSDRMLTVNGFNQKI